MFKKQVLFIVAPSNFRDEEYIRPKSVLEAAGITVVTASTIVGTLIGKFGSTATSTMTLDQISPESYDAIAYIGGSGCAIFLNDKTAHSIASTAYSNEQLVAAICMAPSVLANAGILKDKQVTAYPTEQDHIEKMGGHYTGALIEEDGNIVTASGPDAARKFGEVILKHIRPKNQWS